MKDIQDIQILAQLLGNLDTAIKRLEKNYNQTNSPEFNQSKKEIMDVQTKIYNLLQ